MTTSFENLINTLSDPEPDADYFDENFKYLFQAAKDLIEETPASLEQDLMVLFEETWRRVANEPSSYPFHSDFAVPLAEMALQFAESYTRDIDPEQFSSPKEEAHALLCIRLERAYELLDEAEIQIVSLTQETKELRAEAMCLIPEVEEYINDCKADQRYLEDLNRQLDGQRARDAKMELASGDDRYYE